MGWVGLAGVVCVGGVCVWSSPDPSAGEGTSTMTARRWWLGLGRRVAGVRGLGLCAACALAGDAGECSPDPSECAGESGLADTEYY